MTDNSGKILRSIRPSRIVWPILLGLAVTGYFFFDEYDQSSFEGINFTFMTIIWIIIAFALMVIRDVGYMIRLKILTNGELGWRKLFNIIMLWEFTSAVTPSAVGGTSVAVFFLNKEGISLGRSAGVVMVTSFLDELFFVILFPLVLFSTGIDSLFSGGSNESVGMTHFLYIALTGYFLKFAYVVILSYGLFYNPRGLKWLLLKLFKLSILRKWRPGAAETGNELIETSMFFRKRKISFWLKSFGATCVSWIARYWVVNALVVAFMGLSALGLWDHVVLFGKQLVMWIMMLISPTPGGSGFAEFVFKEFMPSGISGGEAVALAMVWRLVSYYPYLIIGVFIVPRWIGMHFIRRGK
jgi:uncharacterized protein (TIRG00374 family)